MRDFAVKIWAKATMYEPVYLAIAAIMIQKATNEPQESKNFAFVEFLIQETRAMKIPKIKEALKLLTSGLIINNNKSKSE